MAVIHKKCWPEMFEKFNSGERTIDSRLADFELKSGDILIFEEYDPGKMEYTGREASFECKKVERSVRDPLLFYRPEDITRYGFWNIELEKKY